ncbi:TPA: hypothetical protein ACH3X1_007317 [Trebouxia sp. C0004]
MEVELVGSVHVKHTRASARTWQRVILSSQQVCEKLPQPAPTSTLDANLARTGLWMAREGQGVTGAIPQPRRNKPSYKRLIHASGATAWTSAAACCTIETARSHLLDLVVANHATGHRHIVQWNGDEEGKQPLTPTQKSFTRLHSGLRPEKISGTWKWKQVAVSDDGKAILALTSHEGLPSLWLWTSNTFIGNTAAELPKGPIQVAGDWLAVAVSAGPLSACILMVAVDLTLTAKVSWDTVMFGDKPQQQTLPSGDSEEAVLCSLAWMPDGSALAVMDKWGNLALLDVHGTVHRLQQGVSPAQQHQQAPEAPVIGRAAAASRRGLNAKLLPYAVWGPTRQTTAKRPEPLTASGHTGHHSASVHAVPADKAEQQVLPSAGITLIASPLGVSLSTVKRQDAPALTEGRDLQNGSAASAASPAVLEHLKQGSVGVHQGSLPVAISHYSQADAYGWLALTAAYLHANQTQPALLLLQHAIAHSYSRALDSIGRMDTTTAAAARQLAEEWAGLILRMIRDKVAPGGLTLLLFPAPHLKQLGASQPVASLGLNGQQLRKAQQQSSANLWQLDAAAGLLLLCRPESGAAAAFEVLADAGQWQEAVHLGAACLANGCAQQAQLLAVMASRLGAHMQGLGAMPAHTGAPALANLLQALQAAPESCSSDAASQAPHATSNGLQRLYAALLQQALAQLLDSAAASFAALPVVAAADGRLSEPLEKNLLLHLLGQAILQAATTHGASANKPLPTNTAYICCQLAGQEQLAGVLSMLAGVLAVPRLPSAFMTALVQLGKESAAATLSDLAQELGGALQSQGVLEENDWEEVKDSLNKPAGFTPNAVQLKRLQHQCDIVAYLRGILSVFKPQLGLLIAEAHWNQQLVDDGPSLSTSEDAPPPWGLPTHPFPITSSLHFSSTPEDSKQHADNGLETNQAWESQGVESLDMSQTASEALKGMIKLGWLLLCRARLSRAWQANLKHTQQALMTGSFEVSAQEQACGEEVVKWATAVAAADGVHNSKDTQEGVIGACSGIRQPWPAVPDLLESALPDAPTERAAAMMRRLKASCIDSVPHSTSSDEQGEADWQVEWRAYCSSTMSSLQAWLQSDSDDMAIMQEDIQGGQSDGSASTEDILAFLLSEPILSEAGYRRLPPLSSCFQHPLCLGTGQGRGLDADGALLALQSLLHPSANPQIRAWQQTRVEGIPPQPAPSAIPLPAYDTLSPADIDLSINPPAVSQPKAEAAGSLQSSSTAHTEPGQVMDSSNQAEQSLIKAALETGDSLSSQEGDGIRLENGDIAGPELRHAVFEQPLAAQSFSGVVASQAHDEWTVIQSDGSDIDYNSRSGAKQGLVRVKSALPQEELPQQLQGLGLLHTAPSCGSAGAKALTDDSSQLLKRRLPALKVPLTGMGRPRVAARRGTCRFVAEGMEDVGFASRCSSLVCSGHIADAVGDAQMLMLQSYLHAQPAETQEEEAAYALRQHLSVAGHMLGSSSSNSSAVLLQAPDISVPVSTAQHAQHGSTAGHDCRSKPIAEGTEGRTSIAAFNPSWHLRANQAAQAEEYSSTQTADTFPDADDSLDRFYRPASGLPSQPPQHQPSMVEQAGCLNFGSHVVAKGQLAEAQWDQSVGRKSNNRERSAIDDAALSSEDSESGYEDEPQAQTQAEFEADNNAVSASQSRMTSHDSQEHSVEGRYTDTLPGQGQYEAGQYADYHSEEGQSEEGQYGMEYFEDTGLDQSLDVLPAGITCAPEVYSPMSCGAARVRSLMTNRPFMLEDPVSPVAERRGATMRRGSQLSLTAPAESLGNSEALQGPQQQEEPLYHDWSQPVQDLTATAVEPPAPAPMSEAELAAERAIADAMRKKGKKSNPDAVKTGAISKLTGSLFRRSGKKTAETQTTEYREEETQTSDQPELPTEVMSQELLTAAGHPELGQELSFGDALKAQTAPPTELHYGDLVLSDLLEAHGPLAMTAMSSPTHTSAFVLPSEQTSPAQVAGLADVLDQDLPAQIMTQHSSEPLLQQPALTGLLPEAVPAAAGDMMTFQVDGHLKLGLRPRQLTFSASAQPPPQLWLQSQDGSQAFEQSPFAGSQSAPPAVSHAKQPADKPSHSSGATASGHLPDGVTASQSCNRSLQSAQPGSVSLTLQPQVSSVATAVPPAAPESRQPSIQADDMTTAVETQCGQELTTVAPSLSWPEPATAAAAPSTQNSAAAPLLSRQPSAAMQPPSRQLSAAIQPPSRQASATVPPSLHEPSAVGQPPSRQTSAVAAPHSRQSSGMPLPLSKQSSAVVPPPPTLSRQPPTSAEPHQAAGPGPRQGLEQAWAALLPSLLAEATRQGGDATAAVPAAARLPAGSQTRADAAVPVQTVGDILKMWAPLPKAMTAGGPAQSASQLLRAMRLDRGLSKGREGLTEREQQPNMSMGGTPGRPTGQRHQARSADARGMLSEGSTGNSRLPLNYPHAHGLRLLRVDPRQQQSGRDAHTGAFARDVHAVQERTQAASNQLRLLRLPVAPLPAPTPAPEQSPQPSKQPLQDANGRHDPPPLLPAPSYPPSQLRASSNTDHTVRSSAQPLRSHEPASITVGSIANAYFGSAPGGAAPAWGHSQLGPVPEASQSAALAGLGFSMFHSPAATSPASDHAQLPHTSDSVPYASNYLAGLPWEAASAAGMSTQLPLQMPQQNNADRKLEFDSKQSSGMPIAAATSRPNSTVVSNSSSKRAKSALHGKQPSLNAGAAPKSPRAVANSFGEATMSKPGLATDSRSGQSEHQKRNRSPPHYHEARLPGAPGNSCYDATIRVQRLGHSQQSPGASAEAVCAPDHNRGKSQQAKRRQAALQQLAARSRSRSASSSRAVSQQPSRADLDLPQSLDHSLLNAALDEDAAAARLAGDYLAAVQSAASIHSSASSWPQQVDIPAQGQRQQGSRGKGIMGQDWEGVLRRGLELAEGATTDQFLQVVDLYPEERIGQINLSGQSDWHLESSAALRQPHVSKQRGMAAELADILSQLDDAARLADELDFGVGSRLH